MKHLLNNLTSEEKSKILEQHSGGMSVMTENFKKLTTSKLGDAKPLISEQEESNEAGQCSDNDLKLIPKIIQRNADLTLIFNELASNVVTVISKEANINCGCKKDKLMQFLK